MFRNRFNLLFAGISLFALIPGICKGEPAKLSVHVISVEETDISALKNFSQDNKVLPKGNAVSPALQSGICTRFYGEVGMYPRFFQIEKKAEKAADLLIRIFFSQLHFRDVEKRDDFGRKVIERNYALSLNLTVENQQKKILLCRNLDFEYSLPKEKKNLFPKNDVIFRKMICSCLQKAAKLMAEKFSVRYKITVKGPTGDKKFPKDDVEIFLDGDAVFNHAITQCVKGKHEVVINAPEGYESQKFFITLEKDSQTTIKLFKKGK